MKIKLEPYFSPQQNSAQMDQTPEILWALEENIWETIHGINVANDFLNMISIAQEVIQELKNGIGSN
jgi:hypothetical protein